MKKMKYILPLLLFASLLVSCTAKEEKNTTGIAASEINNEAFKDKFPEQYASYQKNADMSDTLYVGSINQSKFSADKEPLLPILFYNYGFSTDYNEDRGHIYANDDVAATLRVNDKTPGACLTCKSSAVPQLIEQMGDNYWKASFKNEIYPKAVDMEHSAVGCSDCHNPETMELQVSRPSFLTELEDQGIDIKKSSKQEMRSYVCAQCHSEYYFIPETYEVSHPWDFISIDGKAKDSMAFSKRNDSSALKMFVYYESVAKERTFNQDFIHAVSGTPILKAQHPEFEMSLEGPHAKAGVSCSDCHMPKEQTSSGKTISSHYMTSPLKQQPESCNQGGCHQSTDAQTLKKQTEDIQKAFKEKLDIAEDRSVNSHYYVNRMITAGVDAEKIKEAQLQIRFAQWMWDYCAAENSVGFHNPEGSSYFLDLSIESSDHALKIATDTLNQRGVDLAELDAEIAKVKQAVANESDTSKKKNYVTNDFFPAQQ